jgi:hypothetical protein
VRLVWLLGPAGFPRAREKKRKKQLAKIDEARKTELCLPAPLEDCSPPGMHPSPAKPGE